MQLIWYGLYTSVYDVLYTIISITKLLRSSFNCWRIHWHVILLQYYCVRYRVNLKANFSHKTEKGGWKIFYQDVIKNKFPIQFSSFVLQYVYLCVNIEIQTKNEHLKALSLNNTYRHSSDLRSWLSWKLQMRWKSHWRRWGSCSGVKVWWRSQSCWCWRKENQLIASLI